MRINQLKIGAVLSYATQGIHILTGLIYTPVMLRLLGQSEYGLYQLVNSVVSYLSLLSLGFSAAYVRFYSRYKVENNDEGIAKINGMFLSFFTIISVICLLCGGVMVANIDMVLGSGLTTKEQATARVLMFLMVINMALSFMTSVFTCNINAHERFFFQKIVEFLRVLFNPFLTLPLLLLGFGSIGMVVVTTALTLFSLVLHVYYCFKKLKMKFSFRNFNFGLLKELWAFTFFIFINMIVDRFNWSIDQILLGRIIGTAAVAIYGIAGQLNTMYMLFAGSVSAVFVPRINMLVAKETENSKIITLFARVGRIQTIILGLIISGYVLFGKEFIYWWAGKGYEDSYVIGLFLMLPLTIPLVQNLGLEIQRAKNMHKARSVIYLFIAICNIFISIPCIKAWGAKGAAIGTAISLIIGNGIFMNWYYHKKIKLDMVYFWGQIIKIFPSIFVVAILGFILKLILPMQNVAVLALTIVIYCMIYVIVVWLFGMNSSEKELFINPVKKVLKRFNG